MNIHFLEEEEEDEDEEDEEGGGEARSWSLPEENGDEECMSPLSFLPSLLFSFSSSSTFLQRVRICLELYASSSFLFLLLARCHPQTLGDHLNYWLPPAAIRLANQLSSGGGGGGKEGRASPFPCAFRGGRNETGRKEEEESGKGGGGG